MIKKIFMLVTLEFISCGKRNKFVTSTISIHFLFPRKVRINVVQRSARVGETHWKANTDCDDTDVT